MTKKPTILVLGSSGQIGKLLSESLKSDDSIILRVSTRQKDRIQELSEQYAEAVYLDLDNPLTFDSALKGVDRLFLLTGYSVSMLVQSKTIIDAARKAGIEHIVHLGVFSLEHNCTAPHFAWHQMIEAYLKDSGIKWTFLHPNCFLQNLINFSLIKNGRIRWYAQNTPCGWIALEDVAEAAAKILIEGPQRHHSEDYWFSTESLTLLEVTELLRTKVNPEFTADPQSSEQFLIDMGADKQTLDPYFYSVAESFKQIEDGRMAFISEVKDDLPLIIKRFGMKVSDWIELHRNDLNQLAQQQTAESSAEWGKK